jgi:hypothetical protein
MPGPPPDPLGFGAQYLMNDVQHSADAVQYNESGQLFYPAIEVPYEVHNTQLYGNFDKEPVNNVAHQPLNGDQQNFNTAFVSLGGSFEPSHRPTVPATSLPCPPAFVSPVLSPPSSVTIPVLPSQVPPGTAPHIAPMVFTFASPSAGDTAPNPSGAGPVDEVPSLHDAAAERKKQRVAKAQMTRQQNKERSAADALAFAASVGTHNRVLAAALKHLRGIIPAVKTGAQPLLHQLVDTLDYIEKRHNYPPRYQVRDFTHASLIPSSIDH